MDHIDRDDPVAAEERPAFEPAPSLLAGLTRAMHETAERERRSMVEAAARDATRHVGLAHTRAAIEADELRRSATEDIEAIEAWTESEVVRIRETGARRATQRRADLDAYIERHASIIEAEVAGVDFAVAEYQAAVDAFMDGVLTSNDAADIARRAASVPPPPDLDRARATARAAAVARYVAEEAAAGVGVMDQAAVGRPDGLALAVDPLQAPDEDLVVVSVAPDAAVADSAPSRLIRVLGQWLAAPDPDRSEAARKG